MRTLFNAPGRLVLGIGFVVLVAVLSLLLHSLGHRHANTKKAPDISSIVKNGGRKMTMRAEHPATSEPSVVDAKSVPLSDPEFDALIAQTTERIYKDFEEQVGTAQFKEFAEFVATAETVETTVNDLLLTPNEVLRLLTWIRTADEKEKAWIFDVLTERFNSDPDPRVRRACLIGVSRFPKKGLDVLERALLTDPDQGVQRLSAYLLGSCGTEQQIGTLLEAVKKDKGIASHGRTIAREAIIAVGSIGGVRAGETLKEIWYNEELSTDCREQVITAAGLSGQGDLFGLVNDILKDKDEYLRDNAAYALGMLGKANPKRSDLVNNIVITLRQCLTDKNPHVRKNAVGSLGEIGTKEDIRYLEMLLQDTYIETVSYVEDGEEKTKQIFPIRDKAKGAIDKINARFASKG